MTDTTNLGLPNIEAAQAQKHVTHNDALRMLDALVQLAVADRDLSTPPASPAEGGRWIVKATGTDAWIGHDNAIAAWQDGAWQFYAPQTGWRVYVADEGVLLAWNGTAWGDVSTVPSEMQDLSLLGVGATADTTNPLSAILNNALFTAKNVADGGDGNLRYKLSKEAAANTLCYLFQDNFSGRAEIGLCGDDDFHFKTSPDGSTWTDALLIDNATGSAKLNSGFYLTGVLSPAQIAADQNDYNPTGLASASVLRLYSDASRTLTGLSGGGAGRVVTLVNVGSYPILLAGESTSSAAGNRFTFNGSLTLQPRETARLWYDATSSRWRLVSSRKFPVGLFYADRGGSNQTGATASAFNKVQANNEVVDKCGWYDAATNYRYAPQEPGFYLFFAQSRTTSGTGGETCESAIAKNGSVVAKGFYAGSGVSGNGYSTLIALVALNGTTDYAEFYCWVPAAVTSIQGAAADTYWGGFKLADL
ncbi:MAG TPA: DUF2793 domain-containing protein [Pseudolabrys sp.]|nr:DUF2793 domain-containing protein [Pseudolabrys sp.]